MTNQLTITTDSIHSARSATSDLEKAARWMLTRNLPAKALREVRLHLKVANRGMGSSRTWGSCRAHLGWTHKPGKAVRQFTIKIRASLSAAQQIETLAHEIIHVTQWVKGHLDFDRTAGARGVKMWKGKLYARCAYLKRPWEVEAFGGEAALAAAYVAKAPKAIVDAPKPPAKPFSHGKLLNQIVVEINGSRKGFRKLTRSVWVTGETTGYTKMYRRNLTVNMQADGTWLIVG